MSRKRDRLRAALKAPQEALPALRRERAALEREEDEWAAERRAARQQAAGAAMLPGGAGVGVLVDVEEPSARDFAGEEAELLAEIETGGSQLNEAATREAPELLGDVATATEPFRGALAALGEAAVPAFIEVLATIEPREKALEQVAALARDFRGDPRTIGAQRAAIQKYLRSLLADATQNEIAGLLVFQVLMWARRGSTPLEPTWAEHGIPLLDGSVLMGAPVIGGVVRDGSLPL